MFQANEEWCYRHEKGKRLGMGRDPFSGVSITLVCDDCQRGYPAVTRSHGQVTFSSPPRPRRWWLWRLLAALHLW